MSTNLTHIEQRGWLTVRRDGHPLITRQTIPGWFTLSLDGKYVTMRRVGGRNRWSFASIDTVIEFRADETAK
jgi:hypothetical protein